MQDTVWGLKQPHCNWLGLTVPPQRTAENELDQVIRKNTTVLCKASRGMAMEELVELAGGTVTERGAYPGWQYRRDSQFRETLLAAYKDLTGKDGVVEATHGGLECGLLMEKIPGLDAVSMGPELHDVHSVRERLSVPSTERTYELVCELLRRSC